MVRDIEKKSATEYRAIVHEIIERSSLFNMCSIVHEFRSSIFEARNLAKHVLTLGFGRHV